MGFCLTLSLSVALPLFSGCNASSPTAAKVQPSSSDQRSLQQQIDDFQNKLAQREGELQGDRDDAVGPLPAWDVDAAPRLTGVLLGRYSGPADVDGDGVYDELRVYVVPIDQRSRPIEVDATVRVRLLSESSAGEPAVLLGHNVDADAFREAQQRSVIGPRYALKLDLPADPPDEATLSVTLTDTATRRVYRAEKPVAFVRSVAP